MVGPDRAGGARLTPTQILHETRGAVALLALNRPERLNAWTRTMYGEGSRRPSGLVRPAAVPFIHPLIPGGPP